MSIAPGLEATVDRIVTHEDTAMTLGSGDVEVLGTPAVVALLELAAVHALVGSLEPNQTSVGTHIDIEHLAPTVPGRHVVARAVLVGVDGRKCEFTVEATDPSGVIARGTHSRVLVDRKRFLAGAEER